MLEIRILELSTRNTVADLGFRKMINDNKRSPNWKGRVGEVMPAKMLIGIERNAATQRYNG